jgi:hypothetical protein
MGSLWLLLGLLVLLGGGGIRRLLRARTGRQPFLIDDEAVRGIERDGFLAVEDPEPLDPEGIARAEEEFWQREPWEEADDF